MRLQGSIRAVNLRILSMVNSNIDHTGTASLASAKLAAKFEEPCDTTAALRRTDAWERWIAADRGLYQQGGIIGPSWAKARLSVRECLSHFRLGELTFTGGSSFEPLGVHTGVAEKLRGVWTVTADCFPLFAKYSYFHRALRSAVKKRFSAYCKSKGWVERDINRKLWRRFCKTQNPAFQIYRFKLFCTSTFVGGNRWSTVPKNNSKDRSICLEPLCNMLVQRAIGIGIRRCLKDNLGIDLDNLADVHRHRISDPKVATIDLSDCSDTISLDLVKYLFPRHIFNLICDSRSDMTLGPSDDYYIVNKVSSMGNGFTFDLMSLILTALTRVHDPAATVFGDDIVCQNQVATAVCSDLALAGFRVNVEKTRINSSYRESCGAHYTDSEGYLTIFDLKWINSPHDLVVALNKVAILSYRYGGYFEDLRRDLWSLVPQTLLGAAVKRQTALTSRPLTHDLDTYVRWGPEILVPPSPKILRLLRRAGRNLDKCGTFSVAVSFETTTSPAGDRLRSSDWDLFYQWIRSGRRSRRVPGIVNKSTLVARVNGEQIGPVRALLP